MRCSLDWDRRARITPVEKRKVSAPRLGRAYRTKRSRRVPRKPGLELSWGVTTAQREPQWNADRRAVPAGAAPPPLERCRTRMVRKAGFKPVTRLSAFRYLFYFFRSFVHRA